ncbi:hypothetical protein B0O99DRAFT_554606 [Bisporella sp. PMI_857]|nr:hypothetical protein B0O99DRAFT_554606 [Bisporella sp. PMI_857]
MIYHLSPMIILFFLFFVSIAAAKPATNQFQHWYREFGFIFERIRINNCTPEYEAYLSGQINSSYIDWYSGAETTNGLAQPVVNCILGYTSEFIKSNMNSAGVLLGLMPTILAAVGSSADETSMLSVISRRPLLALLLATGSPAVFPRRSFEHRDPIGILREREGRLHPPVLSGFTRALIMVIEYFFTLAAIANVVTISWELGRQVICTFAPQVTYIPLLWAVLNIGIHISQAIALQLRTTVSCPRKSYSILSLIKIQFTSLDHQRPMHITVHPETYAYIFFSWLTPLFTVLHGLFGTLAFSSMLFISVRDSLYVISRYMFSVIICRMVLMYELALLRDCYNSKLAGPGPEFEIPPNGKNLKQETALSSQRAF